MRTAGGTTENAARELQEAGSPFRIRVVPAGRCQPAFAVADVVFFLMWGVLHQS